MSKAIQCAEEYMRVQAEREREGWGKDDASKRKLLVGLMARYFPSE